MTRVSDFFRCAVCRKLHLKFTGRRCPCGEPFPTDLQEYVLR